jgi:peptidoglycan/LPS O-acetylase OafA/YrhL
MEVKKIYFKNLDALRLLTFVFVFFRHAFFTNDPLIEQSTVFNQFYDFFSFAYIALDFFSVLSSFLITWLILIEYKNKSSFNTKNFLMRRILRIWPLYFLIIFIGFIIVPYVATMFHQPVPELPSINWFLFFGLNYYMAYVDDDFLFFLAFLWFIVIEEQFYLFWAFVLKFLKNYLVIICYALISIHLIVLYLYSDTDFPAFYDTVNYLPNFSIGALLAYSCFNRDRFYFILAKMPSQFWVMFYLLFIIVVIFQKQVFSNIHLFHFRHVILSVFCCILIFGQTFSTTSLFQAGKNRIINYIGRLNFGLYCWHGVVITAMKKYLEYINYSESYTSVLFIQPLIALLLTLIFSIISFEVFEKRFLRLKTYFSK